MCGRFTLKTPPSEWVQQLFPNIEVLGLSEESHQPRYNVAPTQSILTLVGERPGEPIRASWMRWGLIPPWSKDKSIGSRMLNARSETAAEKPSFRGPLAKQRCLIVADGYYEWHVNEDGTKQPFWIYPNQGPCFLMAGLWESNSKIEPSAPLFTTTILTTAANVTLSSIHDRMPVVIRAPQATEWLDCGLTDTARIQENLIAIDDDFFGAKPVKTFVNNARNEGPECLDEV